MITALVMAAPAVLHVCSCRRAYTEAEWDRLPLVGYQADEAEVIEYRNCTCESTRAVVIWRAPETPTESP